MRWSATYSTVTATYSATTPPASAQIFSWQDCYLGGAGYPTSGCGHLGQGMRPTTATFVVTGRWPVDDPANPGHLVVADPPAPIPFPTWMVAPPPATPTAPVVIAKVPAPRPAPAQYGEAFSVKVFKTDNSHSVNGDDLATTNTAVVPSDSTQIETPWKLLQSPPPGVNGKHGSHSNQSALAIVTSAVVRRYEIYNYTGKYDPVTHEALCADLVGNAPSTGELGSVLGAQNSASNVVADSLTVTKTGTGSSSATVSGGSINCAVPVRRSPPTAHRSLSRRIQGRPSSRVGAASAQARN